jgi:cell division protein FtsL
MALQEARHYRDELNIEWRKLILEESTWSVHDLVERNARRKLGMIVPKPDQVLVLSVQK